MTLNYTDDQFKNATYTEVYCIKNLQLFYVSYVALWREEVYKLYITIICCVTKPTQLQGHLLSIYLSHF